MKIFLVIAVLFAMQQKDKDEVLLKTYCKVIEHGYFEFIVSDKSSGGEVFVFHYDIDTRGKKVKISLVEHKILTTIKDKNSYYCSEQWNTKQKGTYREKYYWIIDESFLEMSNAEKLELLKNLANPH